MAMKLITFLLATSALFQESHLQVSKMGVCPKDIKSKPGFKAEDFKGTWFEIKRYPTVMITGKCLSIDYQTTENGTKIATSQTMPGLNTTTSASGMAYFPKSKGNKDAVPGAWTYKMTLGFLSSNASFTIVDTDYKNWAVMYSCADFFGFSSLQFAWIYSRTRELSQLNQDAAIEAFKKQNIDISALVMSDQAECTVEKPKMKQ